MRRLVFIAIATLLGGCLSKTTTLLCESNEDCPDDRRCEVISGLCVPSLEPPTNRMGGISGAFDCALPDEGEGLRSKVPGLASVVVAPPERDMTCNGGPAGEIDGLEVGCQVTRETRPRLGRGGEDPAFWVLKFEQIAGDPTAPEVRVTILVRVDAAAVGELSAPTDVALRYSERCTRQGASQLRLRYVSTQGSLTISQFEEGRIQGRFDIELAGLSDGRAFGEACALPKPCPEGNCAAAELGTGACMSGSCLPDPNAPDAERGYCSGQCTDAFECGFDREAAPQAYCLVSPGRTEGQCVSLCDPDADTCPTGSSCRPGEDFGEFGPIGPPRCLDDCIGTPSHPVGPDCSMPTPMDAGVARDAGPPDSGRPDAGRPADSGVADSGVPDDAGQAGSPLGTPCSMQSPCPGGWFCAQAAAGPLGNTGHCSRGCSVEGDCTAGYTGPGQVTCTPAVRNLQSGMVVNPACMILCGADFGQDGMCPASMTCGDIINNTSRMPPGDGAPDFCTE